MGSLNVGVIGCGVWGRHHARVFRQIPFTNLHTVSDIDEKRVKEIAKLYGSGFTCDPDKIIEDPEIELVSICTPTVTHAELGLRALEAGKHVLVEKPMTDTLAEARGLMDMAERKGVKFTVGFVERFNPAVSKALELVNEGAIGDVILAHTRRVSRHPLRIGDVGVIKDLAIHDIDIICQLFPNGPEKVFCTAGSLAHGFEDYANISLRYRGDRNAFIETNWLTPRVIRNLSITGSEGIITVQYRTQEVTLENNEKLVQPFLRYEEPLYKELESFSRSVIEDTSPVVSGMDGYRALKICTVALLSAKNGEAVSYDEVE
ncbi:MAG: Gfo/Idh/MocA family oxidoreductase [Candidatus Bathyarchaeota archaeon]|nr:Gfo/Idh/MocA family oxidoreductase [Candidatus Bathyarchaeota archaeon]